MQRRRQLRFLLCVIYNAALPQRATPQWYCCARREFNHYRARMDLIIIGRRLLLLGRETVCEFSCAERVARFLGPARQTRLWFSEESPLAVFVLIWSALHQKNWAPRIEKAKKPRDLSRQLLQKFTRHGPAIEKVYSNLTHSPKLIVDLSLRSSTEEELPGISKVRGGT